MAALRHNRPTIIVYGGTIQTGTRRLDCPSMGYKKGEAVNISDAFESYGIICFILVQATAVTLSFLKGAYTVGHINDEERLDVVRHACPGPGACGGMYTCVTTSLSSIVVLQYF